MSFINELTEVSKINQRFMYRRNSRETSIEAARSVHPSLSAIALEVLRYAYDQGYAGFTDIQLAIDLDCETSTYRGVIITSCVISQSVQTNCYVCCTSGVVC